MMQHSEELEGFHADGGDSCNCFKKEETMISGPHAHDWARTKYGVRCALCSRFKTCPNCKKSYRKCHCRLSEQVFAATEGK